MIPLHSNASHANCHVEPVDKQVNAEQLKTAAVTYLLVSGMGCPTCAMRVGNALLRLDGVLAVDVILERSVARVFYQQDVVSPDQMPTAVAVTGQESNHSYTAQVLAL